MAGIISVSSELDNLSIKKLEQIKANILSMCPPNNRPIITIRKTSEKKLYNVNEYIMEISQSCERSYKLIRYLYIPSNRSSILDKIIQIWYEDFVNETGYEEFTNDTHEEKTEKELYNDICLLFVNN